MRVLVVDDEPQMVRALLINLRARGYEASAAASGAAALIEAAKHPPDLVLLDLGLPDMDGSDVITGLRGWTAVPIIVLSGRTGGSEKVAALDAGADDYVTKPFGMDELMARMRAVTRRGTAEPGGTGARVRIGDRQIDLATHLAQAADGTEIRLTKTEWALLERLIRNPGKLITQRQLLTEVWGPAYADESGYLRFHFGQLRRKLEADPARPRHLITEPGLGYRFAD
ncbi:two-component system KDP operon response regulator KdpE [Jatrophihabitans sp. GAS493]|nr:response regulator [Jatrophihabitans sp. GAS493]SOD74367.1 two-component system KDP operon response regulator KdpE [Jatrophihabitans sp. GAS493]